MTDETKSYTNQRPPNAACLVVSNQLLKQALELPEDAIIMSVEQDGADRLRQSFRIIIAQKDLPPTAEGGQLPCATTAGWGIEDVADMLKGM